MRRIGAAFVVDVIKRTGVGDEIGRVIVDIPASRVQAAAHRAQLLQPRRVPLPGGAQLRDRRPGMRINSRKRKKDDKRRKK